MSSTIIVTLSHEAALKLDLCKKNTIGDPARPGLELPGRFKDAQFEMT